MKKCAYCGSNATLTKEHIWPNAIIQKYQQKLATYNKRNHHFHFSDPVIKDVCDQCNSVKLSKLDSYISHLYDNHFSEPLSPGESTFIEYDYDLLLRSLLKISYNSSRASGETKKVKTHNRYSSYILNGGHCSNIMLRLQVVTSAKIMKDGELTEDMLPVTQLRCADIAYDGALSHRFMIRLVAINSFWFYIIISHRTEPKHKWREFYEAFSSWKIQPGILMERNVTKLDIPVNKTTYMHPALMGTLLNTTINA